MTQKGHGECESANGDWTIFSYYFYMDNIVQMLTKQLGFYCKLLAGFAAVANMTQIKSNYKEYIYKEHDGYMIGNLLYTK